MMEEMMSQLPFSSDQIPDNVANLTEDKIGSYNVIIDSMTEEEIQDPSVINRERRERIAAGSGTTVEDVQELIKHYRQTKNMVDKFDKKNMKRGNMQNMMQKLGL
jgi:signal recognition particle subunit SRP54